MNSGNYICMYIYNIKVRRNYLFNSECLRTFYRPDYNLSCSGLPLKRVKVTKYHTYMTIIYLSIYLFINYEYNFFILNLNMIK